MRAASATARDGPSSARAGAAVVVTGLSHAYGSLRVLDGVDLTIQSGEHVAVVGPSGSGKSTLLSILGGLESPGAGSVRIDDVELAGLGGRRLATHRRDTVGFVFQHFGLLDALTARENVALACTLSGRPRRDRKTRADELLDAVGLSPRATHQPAQMSGGERQRVAIARAMVGPPRLLLADEPTGNLDAANGAVVMDLLADMCHRHGCTLVVVTHDVAVTRRADRVLAMHDGALIVATPAETAAASTHSVLADGGQP